MRSRKQKHIIFLVTGRVQTGKTTFLTKLVELLRERGLSVGGFLCPGSFDSGKRSGFDLKNIETGVELPMASDREFSDWVKYRRFWFNPGAFLAGKEWIRSSLVQEPAVIVIDEVGPMELEGSGWLESIEFLQSSSVPVQLWSVRESLLEEVMQRWDIGPDHLIQIDKTEFSQAAELIIGIEKSYRESKQTQ